MILKGGSWYAAEGSEWYVDGGPQEPDWSLRFLLTQAGTGRSECIGFRCAVDLAETPGEPGMTAETRSAWSEALGEHVDFRVHVIGAAPTHAVYAWHGRGGSARDWDAVVPAVAGLVAEGELPSMVLVAPEAPWSDGGSWYVDSQYAGRPAGRRSRPR